MSTSVEEKNKALVLLAFDTLFNKRDFAAAEKFWSPNYIQHSAHVPPGRDGLFNIVRHSPPSARHEPGLILAGGDFVMMHGRFSGRATPPDWIVVDILRVENNVLVEHWDVIQEEATRTSSKGGYPMFGRKFPDES